MLQGVNIEDIKKYNSTLKQYKDKAATLKAEIDYTHKELDSLCEELTAELGVTVTRENIEEIYNEQVNKIQSALQSGNAVLAKIASEQNNQNNQIIQSQVVQQATQNNQNTVYTTTPVEQQGVFTGIPEPVQGSVFNTSGATANTLPPLFN